MSQSSKSKKKNQNPQQILQEKIRDIEELEKLLKIKQGLPHRHGFPWYRWAKKFYDSTNKIEILTAANQVSKSSTNIRTAIEWITNQELHKKLWPNLLPGQKPNQFWYFYPTAEVWQAEFESKWEPDFLPRNEFKDDPIYGWRPVYDKGMIKKIVFNIGITVYCKTYSQKVKDLQTGSVHALFLDEECPADYIPELQARIRATNGYIRSVFTATLGQEFWRRVMEPTTKDEEIWPHASKQTVSLYDSQYYIDGTPSQWTTERIEQVIQECATEAEVQRRVFGRFVKSEGLKYESFDLQRNTIASSNIIIPKSYPVFAGVDPGSGGKSGHPAAIIFLAVRPDYKHAVVYKGWRGDGIPTANPDILIKFRELKGNDLTMSQVYDYKDKDFQLVAQSYGEPFEMAKKQREEGAGLLNSLFKNKMLTIIKDDPELNKLITELLTLSNTTDKRIAKDDMIDALRYTVMAVPWDFSDIRPDNAPKDTKDFNDPPPDTRTEAQKLSDEILKQRRAFATNQVETQAEGQYDEINYWNDILGE
jgi:hypothetical protein